MKEPIRQEIREAFNKTIERWEKIVENVWYFDQSNCALCQIHPQANCQPEICPIAIYVEKRGCFATPYQAFANDKTPANALAELNFLRKVYIWWMERGKEDRPEEKKEGRKVGVCGMCGCNFLQEDGGCSFAGYCKHKSPEEKKKEWVEVTSETKPVLHLHGGDYYDIHFHLESDPRKNGIGHMYANGETHFYNEDYKIERKGDAKLTFRILKKL